ncbi:hypothetical protein [Serratia ficaria]|nr:hypothetical protein [Serratia ficaria]CAI1141113.1 Uncharacterised protein [Serratia ficaria]CAI2515329.1 Uncharacterised protein [Serratia ficaria]
MVSLNARIQHKHDLSGGDFAAKRHHGKHVFFLVIFSLCLLAAGAIWG